MKRESRIVNGTPQKRLFWSIISDYSVSTSMCELIDNALDIWLRSGKQTDLIVEIDLDLHNRSIQITDNAGGVPESELQVLISPGASLNNPDENVIGLFGVGSKRAVVALAQTVRIRTRRGEGKTYQIDIDENWLEDEDWDMPVYEVDEIAPNTTIVDLMRLRHTLDDAVQGELRTHLRETYGRFLRNERFDIKVNSESLEPLLFDAWAYPPGFEPRYYMFEVNTEDGEKVGVEIYAGLIKDRDPSGDNYGVYFYCNDRLNNKAVIADRPWVVGLLESLAAQELISRQRLETRNRIALILLDSAFEIALKEYIVHTEGLNLHGKSLEDLFRHRDTVIAVVSQKVTFPPAVLMRIRHYYLMRNKLVHERATVDVTDGDIANFRDAVGNSLGLLFDVVV